MAGVKTQDLAISIFIRLSENIRQKLAPRIIFLHPLDKFKFIIYISFM